MISLQNALEPSSCAAALVGPKQRMPAFAERVGEARHERRLGTDHHEVDVLGGGGGDDPVDVLGPDRDHAGVGLDPGVARARR